MPVLLIDDDPALRATLRRILHTMKLQVIEAEDGEAGLSLFREQEPWLVITDVMMPNKDGIETVREMRAIDPHARIIVMSGGGGDKYADPLALALAEGAIDTLPKPFRAEQVRAAVSRALDAKAD